MGSIPNRDISGDARCRSRAVIEFFCARAALGGQVSGANRRSQILPGSKEVARGRRGGFMYSYGDRIRAVKLYLDWVHSRDCGDDIDVFRVLATATMA